MRTRNDRPRPVRSSAAETHLFPQFLVRAVSGPTMLSQAARRYRRDIATGRLALHTGSLTQLPFADSALDGVLTVNTIYFIAELDPAFTELARVVGSAGRIVVGLADPDAMARMPFTGHGFQLRSVSEVIDTLRCAGLAVEHRRIGQADDAPHLLIATLSPPHL